jgi:nucleotide-binding universal stress UspA family protein
VGFYGLFALLCEPFNYWKKANFEFQTLLNQFYMEKILLPTDFSEYSKAARDYAIALAQKSGAEVHFEHTMLVAVDWENMSNSDRLMYPELKKAIEDAEANLEYEAKAVRDSGVTAHYRLTFNEGLIDIPKDIRDHGYDLAIIGSHGTSGLKSTLLGSNAQRMLRYSPCPVLVVKKPNPNVAINRIAFASDFEEDKPHSFKHIKDFTEAVSAKVNLLYINTPVNFETSVKSKEKLEKYQEAYPELIEDYEIFNHYTEDEGIVEYMKDEKADMLAIATHGRSGWTRLFTGSITESIVANGDFPVLSVSLK